MSAEQIIINKTKKSTTLKTSILNDNKFSGRVDIYDLISRAQKEKDKENMSNYIIYFLFALLVVISGIILSF